MLRLSSSFSRKIPGEEPYSSVQYHSSVEVELPAGMTEQQLRSKIRDTFELVERAVEDEIAGRTGQTPSRREERPQGRQQRQRQPEGKASNKQVSYLLDLAKSRAIPLTELNADVLERFGVDSCYSLSRADCSFMIDHLQRQKAAA